MGNHDVEAQPAEGAPAEAAKTAASGGGKASVILLLLVAVPALIVGSVALSKINTASTLQSQQSIDVSTAQKSGDESRGGSSATATGTLDNVVSRYRGERKNLGDKNTRQSRGSRGFGGNEWICRGFLRC